MKDKLEEFLWVLDHSRRMQVCYWLGIVAFVVTLVLGHVMTESVQFQGALTPLTETIRDRLLRRYDVVAFGALFALWGAGLECFGKERRLLFGLR